MKKDHFAGVDGVADIKKEMEDKTDWNNANAHEFSVEVSQVSYMSRLNHERAFLMLVNWSSATSTHVIWNTKTTFALKLSSLIKWLLARKNNLSFPH